MAWAGRAGGSLVDLGAPHLHSQGNSIDVYAFLALPGS
jgi:hypothetical protein